jgi:uncharacterized protein (TIGR03435 family)
MIRSLCVLALLSSEVAFGQSTTPVEPVSSKPLSFEVISIRPSKPGTNWSIRWATTPDGYHVQGQSIANTILMAYYPQPISTWEGRLVGAPGWLTSELYDIEAKVAESDMAAWQKQGASLDRKPLLRQMLQSMLADRCHLAFHRVPAQLDGWRLELAKNPPHLTEAKPDEQLPQGVKLADGGILVPWQRGQAVITRYYGATMVDLARQLSIYSQGHPVEDHTGLTDRYDFSLSWITDAEHPERDGMVSSTDPDPLSHWDLNALGFRLVPMKVAIDNLVIDHIEKPSEN